MPYRKNSTLPKQVRNNLPQGAQTIWRKAFNNAYKEYNGDEEKAARTAWSAVKKVYKKDKKTGKWVRRKTKKRKK